MRNPRVIRAHRAGFLALAAIGVLLMSCESPSHSATRPSALSPTTAPATASARVTSSEPSPAPAPASSIPVRPSATVPTTRVITPSPQHAPTPPAPKPPPTTALQPPPTTQPKPPPAPSNLPAGKRVYVLGDSVLLGTVQTLPAALPGWQVTMDCVGSRRLPQGIVVLQANRAKLGSVVVIQQGNNYIAGEDGTFASQIDQAMQVLQGVPRVVWVTVAEKWPSRATINQSIRAAATRWPTIVVADWAPMIAAHPEYAYDMLHLTPAGRVAISQLIARAVG